MSFILDALKKSEKERARQNGPALLEARIVPPRRGPPAWAVVVVLILVANLALLAYVLLRRSPGTETTAPVAVAPAPTPAPAPAPATVENVRPPPPPPPAAPTAAPSPPVTAEAAPEPEPPPRAQVVNPADYAPARPASPSPRTPAATAPATMDPSLPTAGDLVARGVGLPALRLMLHVFDEQPRNRYVLINSQRLGEGETTSDGVRVELIAPEGVLLSWRGQRFRLLPGE
jgi:general secretion pathway protein B